MMASGSFILHQKNGVFRGSDAAYAAPSCMYMCTVVGMACITCSDSSCGLCVTRDAKNAPDLVGPVLMRLKPAGSGAFFAFGVYGDSMVTAIRGSMI